MIAILSPAKTLDFENETKEKHTLARLSSQTKELVHELQKKNEEDLKELMNVSDNIASLNVDRFQNFKERHTTKNARQGIFAFKGDVYQGFEAETLSDDEIDFAQDHIRILSGLYGLLRPLDLIQPYRLEMGTKLQFDDNTSLYDYWDDQLSNLLNRDLEDQGDKILINLASNEYFKAVDKKKLEAEIIDIEFKDFKNGEYKIIAFYAKKARGLMARYIVKNKITDVEDLKGFTYDDYYFDEENSSDSKLSFKRG